MRIATDLSARTRLFGYAAVSASPIQRRVRIEGLEREARLDTWSGFIGLGVSVH
jgi:hypothetical protein